MTAKQDVLRDHGAAGLTAELLEKRINNPADCAVIDALYVMLGEQATAVLEANDCRYFMSHLNRCLKQHPLLSNTLSLDVTIKQVIVEQEIKRLLVNSAYRSWVFRRNAGYTSINLENLPSLIKSDKSNHSNDDQIYDVLKMLSGWGLIYLTWLCEIKGEATINLTEYVELSQLLDSKYQWPKDDLYEQIQLEINTVGLVKYYNDLCHPLASIYSDIYKAIFKCQPAKETLNAVVSAWESRGFSAYIIKNEYAWVREYTHVVQLCQCLLKQQPEHVMQMITGASVTELWAMRTMLMFIARFTNFKPVENFNFNGNDIFELLCAFGKFTFSQDKDYMTAWVNVLQSPQWHLQNPKAVIASAVARDGLFKEIPREDEALGRSLPPSPHDMQP